MSDNQDDAKLKISILTRIIAALCVLLIPISHAFALVQNDGLWASFLVQRPIAETSKWHYLFYSSMRFLDEDHPWKTAILEGGAGYTLVPDRAIWVGYRWVGENPNYGFSQSNILFQQFVCGWTDASSNHGHVRSRLEEISPNHESHLSYRLRERFFLRVPTSYFGGFEPTFFDEVFFQLNKTDYTSHQLVSQNRLFLGFYYYLTPGSFWEVGYINQYLFSTPQRREGHMNHIL